VQAPADPSAKAPLLAGRPNPLTAAAPPPPAFLALPDDDPPDLRRLFSRGSVPEPATEETRPELKRLFSRGGAPPNEDSDEHLRRLFSRGGLAHIDENRPSEEIDVSGPPLNRLFSRGAGFQTPPSDKRTTHSSTLDSVEDVEDVGSLLDSPLQPPHKSLRTGAPSPVPPASLRPLPMDTPSAAAAAAPALLPATVLPTAPMIRQGSIDAVAPVAQARRQPTDYAELAGRLPKVSERLVEASVTADTPSYEDHTFSGITFDLEARRLVPLEFVEIHSVGVRGYLGRVSVYVTEQSFLNKFTDASKWTRVFGPKDVPPSMNVLVDLPLSMPIRLAPGMKIGVYVHSEMPGDMALVYDNRRHPITHEDQIIRIFPGFAHTSNRPFSAHGQWGGAWRPDREFVGRLRYGVRRLLWVPRHHHAFPRGFRRTVVTLLLCHKRPGPMSRLEKMVVFNIINFLPWDWSPHAAQQVEEDEEDAETRALVEHRAREDENQRHIEYLRRFIGHNLLHPVFDPDDEHDVDAEEEEEQDEGADDDMEEEEEGALSPGHQA
jgi:hypothetical protein